MEKNILMAIFHYKRHIITVVSNTHKSPYLSTKKILHKMNYIENPSCSFSADQEETIYHLLWECKHTKALIQELRKRLTDNNIFINVSEISFIFGLYDKGTSTRIAEQQILLEIKYYIYFCECSKASLNL